MFQLILRKKNNDAKLIDSVQENAKSSTSKCRKQADYIKHNKELINGPNAWAFPSPQPTFIGKTNASIIVSKHPAVTSY